MHDTLQSDNSEELVWTFNPWRDKSGPVLRRPPVALLLTALIAAIAGIAMTYPNFPERYVDALREAVQTGIAPDPTGTEAEERRLSVTELEEARQTLEAIDNWPRHAFAWGGFSLLVLLAMTSTLYFPTSYRLDGNGVTVHFLGTTSFRKWGHYRNYYFHDTGVHLTTMPQPSPLDPFRGHFLRYGANRAAVRAFIEEHMLEWKGQPAAP